MEPFYVHIAVLRLTDTNLKVIAFDEDSRFWVRAAVNPYELVTLFRSFVDQSEINLQNVARFADRELYPGALAGSNNNILSSATELSQLGFIEYHPVSFS